MKDETEIWHVGLAYDLDFGDGNEIRIKCQNRWNTMMLSQHEIAYIMVTK